MENVSTFIKRKLSVSSRNDNCNYLCHIIKYIKEKDYVSIHPNIDFNMTVDYLKRPDVQKRFNEIVNEYNIVELSSDLKCDYNVVYLIIDTINKDNVHYILNFWPCFNYECIGVVRKEYAINNYNFCSKE